MAASRDGLSRAALIALVVVLVGIVVWQLSSRPSAGTAAARSPAAAKHKGVKVLPSTRLQHPLDLSLAGIQEMPPPHKARPKVTSRRAIAIAKARHTPGAKSVQAVLVVITDPSAGMSKVLAWDVREVGCFGARPQPSSTPKPKAKSTSNSKPKKSSPSPVGTPSQPAVAPTCNEHRIVIVNAKSGALVETVTF